MSNTVYWETPKGNRYDYHVHKIGTEFKDVPGNYMFAEEHAPGKFTVHYVGETDSMKKRHSSHEKLPCALRKGATHILARGNAGGQAARRKEQDEMIDYLQPGCNVQGR